MMASSDDSVALSPEDETLSIENFDIAKDIADRLRSNFIIMWFILSKINQNLS